MQERFSELRNKEVINLPDGCRLGYTGDLAVDGGALPPDSPASTVVQVFADSTWKILRRGPVSETQIRNAIPPSSGR